MGTPDARDRPLIPQERVELASFTAQDLRERGGVELECVGPEVREIRVELRRRHEPDSGAFLLPRLRQHELVASCEPEPEHGRLRPLRSRCEVAESAGAHEVDAEHELPVRRGKRRFLPRRREPSRRRPSSAESGGSNVFRVAMCAGPAFSIGERETSGASSRTHASTSGSSGNGALHSVFDRLGHFAKVALRFDDLDSTRPRIGSPAVERIVVEARRGNVIEARHHVHAVAVLDGEIVESCGDPRSSRTSAARRSRSRRCRSFGCRPDLADDEIAIACASHLHRPEQLEPVRRLLAKAEATEDDLECGPEPTRLAHTCSGKHAAMLLLCRRRDGRLRATDWPSTRARRRCSRRWPTPPRSSRRRSRPRSTAAAS